MLSHYLNQWWNIVNWTSRNKFSEFWIEIHTFSFKKIYFRMSSGKWRSFCLGLNEERWLPAVLYWNGGHVVISDLDTYEYLRHPTFTFFWSGSFHLSLSIELFMIVSENGLSFDHWKVLTNWGRAAHICIGKLTIIGSDNGLSLRWCQAIIWTSDIILLIRPLGINFIEILIGIQTFSFKKMHLKVPSAKWRPLCLGLNVLTWIIEDLLS